ncbi:MAG: arginine--tRNA ligase, partial [Acidimicrobiia bacterium]
MSVASYLSDVVGSVFSDLGLDPALGLVVPSQRPELAQFQCNGAMAAAKKAGRPPREMADEIVDALAGRPDLARAEVAGPGFINLSLTDDALADWIAATAADDRLGVEPVEDPLTVVVDYAGPNVAKAMHVGHLRATIIGDSIARLFAFLGHRVIRDPHFGDWGYQMGVIIAELARRHPEWPYFDSSNSGPFPDTSPVTLDDLQEIYPTASARSEADAEFAEAAGLATVALQQKRPGYFALWQHMRHVSLVAQRENFADLGVEFDIWYGESDVADLLAPLVALFRESGAAEESEGALVVRVGRPDDNREFPPLLLVNSRGAYLYSTTDVATVWFRSKDLGADLAIYVVDARQADHFTQVFRAAEKGGVMGSMRAEHVGFGTMNGPDGKPFKTREGGVVSLRDLIELVEKAAMTRLDE